MNNSKEVINLISSLRKKKKISIDELAKSVGVAKSTLSRYESGKRDFPINDIGKYANTLNVSIEYLLGLNKVGETSTSQYPKYPSISAGLPVEIDGITEMESEKITIPDYLMGKWAGSSEIYFTKTNGESMNRIMPHDTLIAVNQVELHELKDGDIVVYRNHGEYAVKRFFKDNDRLIFKPDSTDNRFTDDVINVSDADDLTISGKVVMWNVIAD